MTPDFRAVIDSLVAHDAEFVIVGAVALVLHGSGRVTRDLDICYARNHENLKRLSAALARFSPTLRGAPPDLPFKLDAATLQSGLNFTLATSGGDLDLLAELTGLGGFQVVRRLSEPIDLYDHRVHVLSLEGLERAKRAAGRLKDLLDLAEILEIRRRTGR